MWTAQVHTWLSTEAYWTLGRARSARGQGLGKALIAGVTEDLERLNLKRTLLATTDAHGLYAHFGFEPLAVPGKWLARENTAVALPASTAF